MQHQLITPLIIETSVSEHTALIKDEVTAVLSNSNQHKQFPWMTTINPAHIQYINEEAETISISTIRALQNQLSYAASKQTTCIVLLHCQKLSLPAQQALLKLLEEPPANLALILTTTDSSQFLPTITSRCDACSTPNRTTAATPHSKKQTVTHCSFNQLAQSSYSELIDLAQQHKDRDQALSLIRDILHSEHSQLADNPDTITLTRLAACATAYTELKHNGQVQLVLEHCLFSIKNSAE